MKKIIIFGFPHCGTSILKSILGHIDSVHEIYNETNIIHNTSINNKSYILCKYPLTNEEFFTTKYDDYIKIFIVRNPLYVFSSINKRFSYKIPGECSINNYINTLNKFNYYKNNKKENLYLIRYEDIFDDNYKNLKDILNSIGLTYTDHIFNNTEFVNTIVSSVKIPDKPPSNTDHKEYRTWQINQPFINNNDISKIDLTPEQLKKIKENQIINIIYPNLNI